MIYFDNASTTKPYSEVLSIYNKYASDFYFNSSSIHKLGKNNQVLEDKIKENILKNLKLQNKKIIFTSSATESNNLAILGYLSHKANKGFKIYTSNVEHKSVSNVFKYLENNGFIVEYLKVDKNGKIDIEDFKSKIDNKSLFCSIMSVNNEIGNVLNIDEIYEVCKQNNIIFHSDFSQGLFKVDNSLLKKCNMLTISSHKIHGLKSIAALIIDQNINIEPIIYGGGQEYGLRSSTVDIPLIASFYKAIELGNLNYKKNAETVKSLFMYTYSELSKLDFVEINSLISNSTYYILNFSLLDNIKASVVLEELSNNDIFVSSTSACNSKKEEPSYVIKNMFGDDLRSKNTIRLSFCETNTKEEIDIFIKKLQEIAKKGLWKI